MNTQPDNKPLILRTKCHPEANGRKPLLGESAYKLRFPLEDGRDVILEVGQIGFDIMTNHLMDMLSNAPSHTDESLPPAESTLETPKTEGEFKKRTWKPFMMGRWMKTESS